MLENLDNPYLDLMEIWKSWTQVDAETRWDLVCLPWKKGECIQCVGRIQMFLTRIDWLSVQNTHSLPSWHVIRPYFLATLSQGHVIEFWPIK